jgi:hypothetical protein
MLGRHLFPWIATGALMAMGCASAPIYRANNPDVCPPQLPILFAEEGKEHATEKYEAKNGNDQEKKNGKNEDPCKEEKPPRTLFEWAIGKKDKKNCNDDKEEDEKTDDKKDNGDKENNGNGEKCPDNGKAKNGKDKEGEDESEEDVIETDRPDFTEASSTVGRGRIQLEAGYTYLRDRNQGGRFEAHSYPEMILRIGLFADWFELRIGQNFANEFRNENGKVTSPGGPQDLYLGVKLGLTQQKDALPEMALILQMTVPTGVDAFNAESIMPGINLLYGWDIIKDCLTLGGSTQANRALGVAFPGGVDLLEPGDHFYVELAQSLTIGYTLTKKLGMYTEWFAFFPTSSHDPEIGPEHYFDGGFTYKVTPLFQLDIRAGVGLNRHADDFFVGSGFAVKY